MGFPVGYTELLLPKLLFPLFSLFTLLRRLTSAVSCSLGLAADTSHPANDPTTYLPDFEFPSHSLPAALAREALPVALFSALPGPRKPESCTVCLHEFEDEDEVRLPANCPHVFHRSCLDRWIGYEQRTCPLCRAALIPEDLQDSINERLWADAGINDVNGVPDFYHLDDNLMNFYPQIPMDS
ncbi:probable E3 ubiquitin-protein ligase RHA1A [Punica granatum]|uniref:RING-type domain-containing protein n=2 Tax=Punica granatum TaxID=22663 RepID=A0A218XKJ0_PUNGR|nr:probable E3 ubiquitin-protein ligase RHA1A [Punica granatum]OWM85300.1 hypothetical protein CDL15_Pgr028087 [Punica granatum]PKI50934.1 hypothetical protein CRG98_028664 [Punica granatum]